MTLRQSIEKLMQQQPLDSEACQHALNEMLMPNANALQTAAFLVLLRSKSETPEELASFVAALKQRMIPVHTRHPVLDIVGTGGDGANTVNISTGSAILAASCGVKIAKHGNRAVSSLAGSADVLEALGVAIDLSPEKVSRCIDEVGIGFCFSPAFHPAIRELRVLRKELNVPTTFNLLGPLLNPANPSYFLIGVFNESLLPLFANALKQLSVERALVAHGSGLDEISCVGSAKIMEVNKTKITANNIDPQTFGMKRCALTDLQGGDAVHNAQILLAVFSGHHQQYQAIADTFILNAAVALYLYGAYPSIAEAIPHAAENLGNGAALQQLKHWIECSHD